MIDQPFIELINQEIDGVNSPRQSEAVNQYIATHLEAQHLYEDILSLNDTLGKVEQLEPPINLKKRVLNSVISTLSMQVRQVSSLKFSDLFRLPKFTYAIGLTLVIGAVVGIASYSLLIDRNNVVDPSSIYGTMASRPVNLQDGDRIEISVPGVDGVAALRYSADILVAEINVHAENGTDFRLEFPEKSLSFTSFSQSIQGIDGLKITGNSIAAHIQGEQGYIVVFKRKNASAVLLNLKLHRLGSTDFERNLSAGIQPRQH